MSGIAWGVAAAIAVGAAILIERWFAPKPMPEPKPKVVIYRQRQGTSVVRRESFDRAVRWRAKKTSDRLYSEGTVPLNPSCSTATMIVAPSYAFPNDSPELAALLEGCDVSEARFRVKPDTNAKDDFRKAYWHIHGKRWKGALPSNEAA